jgi:hypothetical protein
MAKLAVYSGETSSALRIAYNSMATLHAKLQSSPLSPAGKTRPPPESRAGRDYLFTQKIYPKGSDAIRPYSVLIERPDLYFRVNPTVTERDRCCGNSITTSTPPLLKNPGEPTRNRRGNPSHAHVM